MEEPTTYYIKEDIPEGVGVAATLVAGEFSMDTDHQESQRRQQDRWVREGDKALAPHPLSIMHEVWSVYSSFLHPKHLELIFETRSLVEDQIQCGLQINQCLDMMYVTRTTVPNVCTTLRAVIRNKNE